MPLTNYQELIKKHLTELLEKGEFVTADIVIMTAEREFVTRICAHNNYVPIFCYDGGSGWISFKAIQITQC